MPPARPSLRLLFVALLIVAGFAATEAHAFPDRNARGQIGTRTATNGVSWSAMTYDAQGQLTGALPSGHAPLSYGYDARHNRTRQSPEATPVVTQTSIDELDQVHLRALLSRVYGVE